jgi:ABC-type multidrug transport system ATPase subunit
MFSVRIEQLSKKYSSKTVFEGLTAHINQPIFGVKGKNGSGKSTLIRCLIYLMQPNEGHFTWFNEQNEEISSTKLKESLGIAAPYISLYPQLSVAENINFIGNLRAKSTLIELDTLKTNLSLASIWDQTFRSLSTGQQQRAKIAASICFNPEVLILDEPSTNLDENGQELVKNIVLARKEHNKLTIIASNDSREWQWCDEMIDLG